MRADKKDHLQGQRKTKYLKKIGKGEAKTGDKRSKGSYGEEGSGTLNQADLSEKKNTREEV